ncbi:protein GVQW3 [Trichonephila clavipes]|nr:protein GVQW3 [Trichonephila clavipes]
MAQHKSRKPEPVEYTTDEEDMIVYDAEEEIDSNPDCVKKDGKTFAKIGSCAIKPYTHSLTQQAYGDSVLSRAWVFRWFKAFSEGRDSIENEPRSGRPSVSKTAENIVRIRELMLSDRRLTVRMIGKELNLNHTTIHQILNNELKMRKICAKMVH